jgi:IclR family transcriptional regulator, mhp operon transcriptional activator
MTTAENVDSGSIRAVERALSLLRVMNEHQGLSLKELHLLVGLPKPTVFRLITTLKLAGYVVAEGEGVYRVTEKVRELGSGYTDRSLLIDAGSAIARKVTRQIKWPLAIGTLDRTVVVVRYSTMPYSPLAVQATTIGHRLGLLDSAMGTTYLAFCDMVEREALMAALRQAAPEGRLAEQSISNLLRTVERRGYGLRLPRRRGDSATVAVPICFGADILGVLCMTTFGNLMNTTLLAQHTPILQATAQAIAAEVQARRRT